MLRWTPKYPALFFALSSVSPSASACVSSEGHHCIITAAQPVMQAQVLRSQGSGWGFRVGVRARARV